MLPLSHVVPQDATGQKMQMGQSQTFGNQKEQWAMLGPSKTGTLLNCDKQTFRFQVALVGGSPKIVINYHYSVYTNVMYSLSFSLSIYIYRIHIRRVTPQKIQF
jgi:hypothetical protein